MVGSAIGGILFIDEAYSLSNNNDENGQEAIDTLIKMMEDHRNDLVVIVAGYPKQMEDFLNSNPGMQSRFNKHIQFDDYNEQELLEIIQYMCHKEAYELDEELVNGLQSIFLSLIEHKDSSTFGNARIVRNIFEKLIAYQANRIMSKSNLTKEDLTKLTNFNKSIILLPKITVLGRLQQLFHTLIVPDESSTVSPNCSVLPSIDFISRNLLFSSSN